MKKLRLNPEDLAVEPFEVEAVPRMAGTVQGNDFSQPNCGTGPGDSCGYPLTCGGTSCDSGYPVCYQCSGKTCDSGYPVCYECTVGCTA
ncbi:MAG TPA: hypothetical protein VJT67_08345 [Longimicrobiaceae bacterium]|nr:hypothetical protein [Longimicrobiaceae bacterium]